MTVVAAVTPGDPDAEVEAAASELAVLALDEVAAAEATRAAREATEAIEVARAAAAAAVEVALARWSQAASSAQDVRQRAASALKDAEQDLPAARAAVAAAVQQADHAEAAARDLGGRWFALEDSIRHARDEVAHAETAEVEARQQADLARSVAEARAEEIERTRAGLSDLERSATDAEMAAHAVARALLCEEEALEAARAAVERARETERAAGLGVRAAWERLASVDVAVARASEAVAASERAAQDAVQRAKEAKARAVAAAAEMTDSGSEDMEAAFSAVQRASELSRQVERAQTAHRETARALASAATTREEALAASTVAEEAALLASAEVAQLVAAQEEAVAAVERARAAHAQERARANEARVAATRAADLVTTESTVSGADTWAWGAKTSAAEAIAAAEAAAAHETAVNLLEAARARARTREAELEALRPTLAAARAETVTARRAADAASALVARLAAVVVSARERELQAAALANRLAAASREATSSLGALGMGDAQPAPAPEPRQDPAQATTRRHALGEWNPFDSAEEQPELPALLDPGSEGQGEDGGDDGGGPPFRVTVISPEGEVQDLELDRDVVTIGREPGCDVHVNDMMVSRKQAEIRRNQAFLALVDLNSPNGTFLNGKRIAGLTLLNDGDKIGVGKFHLRVHAAGARGFGPLPEVQVGDHGDERLGGMTLQISPEAARRAAAEAERAKGHVVLPRRGASDLKLFVTESFLVGKGAHCDLALGGWLVPRRVALIVRGVEHYTLYNLTDSTRVLVNDVPVVARAHLTDGAAIEMYGHRITFHMAV